MIIVISCSKIEREPKVETGTISDITTNSAKATGNIIDLGDGTTDHGHCWSTTSTPTTNNFKTSFGTISRTGSYTSLLQDLEPGTKYYIKAYAKNANGEIYYGGEPSFTTTSISSPTITTISVTSITSTTAVSGGNISSDSGAPITARGICWNTSADPTTSLSTKTSDGTGPGTFTSNLTGLTGNTSYHVRAYATNSAGTSYGSDVTFTTPPAITLPMLTTGTTTATSSTTATSGGNVTSDGGAAVTARGVCWSTSANPTVTLSTKTTNGSGTGSFASNITGLTGNTTYHVRAYATNSAGTSYGSDVTFTTPPAITLPMVTTGTTTATSSTTATSGGNVTSDGGATVTTRGVCWSTSQNPTISDSRTTNGTGIGSFTSSITGLSPNTTYYVRAFATNSVETSYGTQVSFITDPINVTDADGNIYNVIRIGTQVWMKENLRTTKYMDGTNIPYVPGSILWMDLTTPAYCWYGNDPYTYKDSFGALYNGRTVNTNKICPTGWHVPSDEEWHQLVLIYDPSAVINDPFVTFNESLIAGGKLKEAGTVHWLNPNTGATNESEFTGLPAGALIHTGEFYYLGFKGYWWSSTGYPGGGAYWHRSLSHENSIVERIPIDWRAGYSIRCIKDN